MRKKIKICFVSHSAGMVGAELSLLETINALKKRGVECTVLLPNTGPMINELNKMNIHWEIITYKRWISNGSPLWKRILLILRNTSYNLFTILPVLHAIRRSKCDLVYTNTITIIAGALAAKFLSKPHIWHIREFGYEDHGFRFDSGDKLGLRLMDILSTECILNSKATFDKYKNYISLEKLHVVYQAVVKRDIGIKCDDDYFDNNYNDNFDVICAIIGTLSVGKRQVEAILAIYELVKMGVNAKLLIVGRGGDYTKYLHSTVEHHGLERHIIFTGHLKNVIPIFNKIDVSLICSRKEAFGRVTVESMRCGIPVIGASSGGTVELINDGYNGFLYTPGNYVELAKKIKTISDNKQKGIEMGLNGRKWVNNNFSEEKYVDEILSIISPLC